MKKNPFADLDRLTDTLEDFVKELEKDIPPELRYNPLEKLDKKDFVTKITKIDPNSVLKAFKAKFPKAKLTKTHVDFILNLIKEQISH